MNKVIMMCRLTKDPDVRYAQTSDLAIAKFLIAVNRRFVREGDPDADFFNCTAFGKQAEFVEKYLHKGSKILLEGRIENNNYTNKDGQKVYGIVIMVETLEFAESKNASSNDESSKAGNAKDGFMSIPDEEDEGLPFN